MRSVRMFLFSLVFFGERNKKKSTIGQWLFIMLFFSCIINVLHAQDKPFTLQNQANKCIIINNTYNVSTQLQPFISNRPISGLAVTCDISLNSDSSLVRIILIDNSYHEYLVSETYSLISDSNRISLVDFAEETACLPGIAPLALLIEIKDASVHLSQITTSRENKIPADARFKHIQKQHAEKINKINSGIRKQGGKWLAGETPVSKLSYEEKKQLLGGSVPNLSGFEYYVGGIFVIPESTESETGQQGITEQFEVDEASAFADEFDWRNRHGRNWVTHAKNQGSCGSCWAFAANGATELLVNLYFNRQLDMDLSEQYAISCANAGNCSGGWAESALDYYVSNGAINETCFPYGHDDLSCSDRCSNPGEIIRIGGKQKFTGKNEDDIKK